MLKGQHYEANSLMQPVDTMLNVIYHADNACIMCQNKLINLRRVVAVGIIVSYFTQFGIIDV